VNNLKKYSRNRIERWCQQAGYKSRHLFLYNEIIIGKIRGRGSWDIEEQLHSSEAAELSADILLKEPQPVAMLSAYLLEIRRNYALIMRKLL